jgi:DNA-binding LytR/AlgR family response regulator
MFLDIQMPGLTGLQLAGISPQMPLIIFLTAYNNYAVEAFNVGAIDYLLKPVSFERFMQASVKALEVHNFKILKQDSDLPYNAVSPAPDAIKFENPVQDNSHFIYVYVDYSLIKIDTNDITHIEGLKDYVKIYLLHQPKPVITRISMKLLEDKLRPFSFMRTHRSYIVSINSITAVKKSLIYINEKELPVGESYRDVLMNTISRQNILHI